MKKQGLPLSTIALVGVLIGSLYMVSKQVVPPPALPPAEPVTQASATMDEHGHPASEHHKEPSPEERKKEMEEQTKKMKQQYEQQRKEQEAREQVQRKAMVEANKKAKLKGENISRYDPTSTTIDAKYFGAMPMGQEGIEETDKAVAIAEAAKAKLSKEEAPKGQKLPNSAPKLAPMSLTP